jgi:hypothetical protein
MAESVTIARPYAEALFRVAKESGNLGQVVRAALPNSDRWLPILKPVRPSVTQCGCPATG